MSRTPRPNHPATWPGTDIIKSLHTPFNWRREGDDPLPLDTGSRATVMPAKTGPKKAGGIAARAGTITGLSVKADKLLKIKPNPDLIKASTPTPTPKHHGGAYSKARQAAT